MSTRHWLLWGALVISIASVPALSQELPQPIPGPTVTPSELAIKELQLRIYRDGQFEQFFELLQLSEEKQQQFLNLVTEAAMFSQELSRGGPLHAEVLHDVQNHYAGEYIRALIELLGDDYPKYQTFAESFPERDLVKGAPLNVPTRERLISMLFEERKIAKCSASWNYKGDLETQKARNTERKACLRASNERILKQASSFLTPAQLEPIERWSRVRLMEPVE